jgi:hypothetical protein
VRSRRLLTIVAVIAVLAVAGGGVWFWRNREPQPSVTAFCAEMTTAQDLDEALVVQDVERISEQAGALRAAAEVAPPEIEPDVSTIAGLTTTLETAISGSTDPAAALDEALRNNEAALQAAAPAGQAVQAYVATNCGIDLNPTETTIP